MPCEWISAGCVEAEENFRFHRAAAHYFALILHELRIAPQWGYFPLLDELLDTIFGMSASLMMLISMNRPMQSKNGMCW